MLTMFSVAKLVSRRPGSSLNTLSLNTFRNLCSQEWGRRPSSLLLSKATHNNNSNNRIIYCSFQFQYYCTKTPEGPVAPAPEVGKTPLRKPTIAPPQKPTLKSYLTQPHSVIEDDQPRVTEQMLTEAAKTRHGVTMTFQQKVAETTKTVWYAAIVIIGLCALVAILWTTAQELFFSDSPNNIYSDSYRILRKNTEVQDALGEPIRAHGADHGRRWRRHVQHSEFVLGDQKILRMKYNVVGKHRSGIVTLQKKAHINGKYDKYSFILLDLNGYPPRQILVEGNDDYDNVEDVD